jgi:uncharacterized coiled-coil protein SlyX
MRKNLDLNYELYKINHKLVKKQQAVINEQKRLIETLEQKLRECNESTAEHHFQ